ncbi:MAG: thioesterase [Gemmiger sp.]|nr:thioesterase [Gemmiger sp.]
MERQPYEFEQEFEVYGYDGDFRGNIRPASVLRYAQEIAGRQCEHYGITQQTYEQTHTAYVLAKLALHFTRVPKIQEKLTLLTQPEALKRAVNKRLTVVLDEAGAEVALVDSRWVLIDTERRMILRKHPPEVCGPWADCIDRELPMRMEKAAETESLGNFRAAYSRCDVNGHLNNTRYVDILMDALPLAALQNATVENLLVFYHKEVPLGEEFELRRASLGENRWYFCGQREGKCCFEAEITLREAL